MSYQEIAQKLSMTIEQVRRIERKALSKLKKIITTNKKFKDLRHYIGVH